MRRFSAWLCLLLGLSLVMTAARARALEIHPADRARTLILELKLDEAESVLGSAVIDDAATGLERGRMLLYATRYEEARKALERPDVLATEQGASLAELARDCERSMAGAFVVHDLHHDVVIRMQDDRDLALAPIIAEVVDASRAAMRRGLGVELPRPTRIELVRDHFSLSAITGLSEDAARTTGTVAIANWGRVAMVSPRSMSAGYPWMDTLAHELTHIALGMGTRDRAPLWFQEGVAKYFEKRWRRPDPYDEHPSPDVIAAAGFELGLARGFDEIGPSVAMLPSPEHAMVVYAEVESFVRYLVGKFGEAVLVELVGWVRDDTGDGVDTGLRAMTGKGLGEWQQVWRAELEGEDLAIPPELTLGGDRGPSVLSVRNVRLGRLLMDRGHHEAAVRVLEPAREELPRELSIRYLLGKAHFRMGHGEQAWAELEHADPPMIPHAGAFALRGRLLADRGDLVGAEVAFFRAVSLNPWSEEVACDMTTPPDLPLADYRSWLCSAARAWPRY